jgi:hypothetical protein
VPGKLLNERNDVVPSLLRHIQRIPAQGLSHVIDRVLSVKELPDIDTGRTQAKATARVGVEENGPVVKLLSKYDVRIGYRFVTVFHRDALPLLRCYHSRQNSNDRRTVARCNLCTRERE